MPDSGWLAARAAARDALLQRIEGELRADGAVAGAWLLGSLGRGTADAWSDVDLCVVLRDATAPATIEDRRGFVARPGSPLLVQDLPRNAPPGGAYLLVLYPHASGPLHVDWYLRPRAGAAVPHDARLLFDHTGLPVAPAPAPALGERAREEGVRAAIFCWAMAPIAAKAVARGQPGEAFDLLRSMARAVERVRAATGPAGDVPAPGEPWPGLLDADPRRQLAGLRHLCREMEAILPRLGPLPLDDPRAGTLTAGAILQVWRFLDAVEARVEAGTDTPPRPPAPPAGPP